MKVRFYGSLADAIGRELKLHALSACSVSQLRMRLAEEHPAAEQLVRSKRFRACVGDVLVGDDYPLSESDTVEFFPPVSGG